MQGKKGIIISILAFVLLIFFAGLLFVFLRRGEVETLRERIVPNEQQEKQKVFVKKVPDLYPNQLIDIDETGLVRGRFDRVENNKLYLEIGTPADISKEYVLELGSESIYECTARYMTGPNGEKIDRLEMFLSLDKLSGSIKFEGNSLNWFLQTVRKGEAVEIRFNESDSGELSPAIIYVYKDVCS